MASDFGYTKDCGMCFGDLSSCAVANCVVKGCATNPKGASCTNCMKEKCNGKFESCTGWTLPSESYLALEAPLAACTADDTSKFEQLDADSFSANLKHCAMRCGGQNPCTGNCMASDFGYTKDCGMCFGDLSSCAVANCVVKGCATNPKGASCTNCMKEKCNPKFESCTGWTLPSESYLALEAPLAACTADDTSKFEQLDADSFSANLKHCAMRCGGQNPCTGNCMKSDFGYTKDCGMCF